MSNQPVNRRAVLGAGVAGLAAASGLVSQAQAQTGPIRIGSTLALTGPLSATGQGLLKATLDLPD